MTAPQCSREPALALHPEMHLQAEAYLQCFRLPTPASNEVTAEPGTVFQPSALCRTGKWPGQLQQTVHTTALTWGLVSPFPFLTHEQTETAAPRISRGPGEGVRPQGHFKAVLKGLVGQHPWVWGLLWAQEDGPHAA